MGDQFDLRGDFRYATVNIKSSIYRGHEVRIPLHRPPRIPHFTNRNAELDYLLTSLRPGWGVTLYGPAGIGKSALVSEALWRLTPGNNPPERFPDGIVLHNFEKQPRVIQALEEIVRAFGEDPYQDTLVIMAKRALAGRQALLVLEGTENADDLQPLLEVRGGCGVLITTQRRKDVIDERLDIASLSIDEALKLLKAWVRIQTTDETAARRICELVGGLPLAVRLIGSYLAEQEEDAVDYFSELEKDPLRILDSEQIQYDSNVFWSLGRSVSRLSREVQEALAVIGLLAISSFDRTVLAAGMVVTEAEVRQFLAELVRYSFLMRMGERYEVSHPLVHTYVRRRLAPETEVVKRLAIYYTTLVEEQSKLGFEGYNRLDLERAHIIAVLIGCNEREEWEVAINLTWAVDDYMDARGRLIEHLTVLEIGLSASRILSNRKKDEAAFLLRLGSVYLRLVQVKDAIKCFEPALTIAQEIGDHEMESTALGAIGMGYNDLGDQKRAIEYFEQALDISRKISSYNKEGPWLAQLGRVYHELGQMEQAIKYLGQALIVSRKAEDRNIETWCLNHLGIVYRDLDQPKRAFEYFEQALVISREIGDRRQEGINLGNLGLAYSDLGKEDQAIKYYEQALTIIHEIGSRYSEIVGLNNLGSAYKNLGQAKRAIECFEQALVIAQKIGDRDREAMCLVNLGSVYIHLGNRQKSIKMLEGAVSIWAELGSPNTFIAKMKLFVARYKILFMLWGLLFRLFASNSPGLSGLNKLRKIMQEEGDRGDFLRAQGYPLFAIIIYKRQLLLTRKIGDRYTEAKWLGKLGLAYRDRKQVERAIDYLEQALVVSREIGNHHDEGNWLGNLGIAYHDLGQMERAIESYEQALVIHRKVGDRYNESVILNHLGLIYSNVGHLERAQECLAESLAIFEEIGSSSTKQVHKALTELQGRSDEN